MTITMTRLRRAATLGTGLTLAAVLAACSGSSGAENPSTDTKNPSAATSQAPSGLEIANPKNAAAMDVCSLLPPDVATELGLKPEGRRKSSLTNPNAPEACVWESSDGGSTKVAFTAFDGRSIRSYYRNKSAYVDFKKLTIDGHPAVRANKNNPMTGGSCDVFLASKHNQVVMAYARLNAKDTGKVDPCDLSKKALKLSVSSWPAAK